MPNQNIRESKQVLDSLVEFFGKVVKPQTVYVCLCCNYQNEDQGETISHLLDKHTLHEIYTILDFDGAFRNVD